MLSWYLELGLGIGGSFMGFFEGWWSAGDDMLRLVAELLGNKDLRYEVTVDAGDRPARRWMVDGGVCNRRGTYSEHVVRISQLVRSGREGISGLSMVSHAVNWRCACHCMVLCRQETRGARCRGPVGKARVTSCIRVKTLHRVRKIGSIGVYGQCWRRCR
jgi:hypothetical protein